jgi:hypothetical protein
MSKHHLSLPSEKKECPAQDGLLLRLSIQQRLLLQGVGISMVISRGKSIKVSNGTLGPGLISP